jgi:hypothetical protein
MRLERVHRQREWDIWDLWRSLLLVEERAEEHADTNQDQDPGPDAVSRRKQIPQADHPEPAAETPAAVSMVMSFMFMHVTHPF